MWLPASVYERLPVFWLIAGVLFMSSAVYFGFGYKWSVYYFATGVVSVLWSVGILVARSRKRNAKASEGAPDVADTGDAAE